MSDPLRSKLIRLAHQKPELRAHLLPLLMGKTAASAKAMVRYRKLEDHLKGKDDKVGLELLDAFADAMGI